MFLSLLSSNFFYNPFPALFRAGAAALGEGAGADLFLQGGVLPETGAGEPPIFSFSLRLAEF